MAHVTADRVRDTSTTTGSGNFTVSGTAPTGFRTLSAVLTANDTFYYAIQHQTSNEWEVGLGTYSSTANEFARTTVYASSAAGSPVNFAVGTKDVFITLAAARTVQLDNNGAIPGITDAGNLTFTGTGRRITGDFSNATVANRVAFQSSTTNGNSVLGVLPNGTSSTSGINFFNSSDLTNAGQFNIFINGAETTIRSAYQGSGTYLPMTFYTGGSERMRVATDGTVQIGTTTSAGKLTVYDPSISNIAVQGDATTQAVLSRSSTDTNSPVVVFRKTRGTVASPSAVATGDQISSFNLQAYGGTNYRTLAQIQSGVEAYVSDTDIAAFIRFNTSAAGGITVSERMRIDSSGNVYVGNTSASAANEKFNVNGFGLFGDRAATNPAVIIGNTGSGLGVVGTYSNHGLELRTNNTERMRIDSSGNVGIGQTSPAVQLDLYSASTSAIRLQGDVTAQVQAARFSTDTGAPVFLLKKARGTTASPTAVASGDFMGQVIFQAYGGTNNRNIAAVTGAVETYTSDTDISSNLRFNTTPTGSVTAVERMRITSAGDVGIGTSSPSQKLRVVGTSGTAQFGAGTASNAVFVNAFDSGSIYMTASAANSTDFGFGAASNIPLFFMTNNVERMRIDSSGNVGIGTSSASQKLTIAGSASTAVYQNITNGTQNFLLGISAGNVPLFGTTSNDPVLVYANNAERMRVDGNGFTTLTGSLGRGAPVTKTGNFTLAATENWVICNGTGSITVTLPAASSWTGREVHLKTIAAQTVVSASSNVVPLTSATAGTAILAATAGKWATLVSDGTNWVIMQAN